jgi:hypothetical protein
MLVSSLKSVIRGFCFKLILFQNSYLYGIDEKSILKFSYLTDFLISGIFGKCNRPNPSDNFEKSISLTRNK